MKKQIKDLTHYVGKEGTALTPLRPAGTVDINGFHLDVLTRGEFIKKGTSVTIMAIEGKK
jgi:membrane-bound ClpP family serine protease